MRKISKIVIFFLAFIIGIYNVKAEEKNLVNIYLFHSNTCPHCQEEIGVLEELQKKYPNIKIYNIIFKFTDKIKIINKIIVLTIQNIFSQEIKYPILLPL